MVETLAAEYEVDRGQLRADVSAYLDELLRGGVIEKL